MKHKRITIVDKDCFGFDILYRGWCMLSLGLTIGSNHFVRKRPRNLFIEIDILFWTFGIEFKKRPRVFKKIDMNLMGVNENE